MQFTKIATLFAIAINASATAIERQNTCGAIALCAEPPAGKCSLKAAPACTASGGTPYCCETVGLVCFGPWCLDPQVLIRVKLNVLNCVNLLNGNTIDVDIPVTLDLADIVLSLL